MKKTKSEQLEEALKRMKALGIMGKVRNDLRQRGLVYYSERQNKVYDGILFYANQCKEIQTIIDNFESKTGNLVYHGQITHTCFGTMLALLYVSENDEEWNIDSRDISNGEALAYVYNMDDPEMSEYGYIGIQPKNGGITRTY